MNILRARIKALQGKPSDAYGTRALAQMAYAIELADIDLAAIRAAADALEESVANTGTITRAAGVEAERRLLPLQAAAKKYGMILVGHAHIDMNWMWRYDETVAITIDTFKTMLRLMDEYPQFTFAQSQASVYRIVEEHDPELLEQIKARVKEGRWEVTASTWVENDHNTPSSESFARHLLYTKDYLSKLLEINPATLKLDYEPDTFGHAANLPEILNSGGVKWYYHCRGFDGRILYRWRAPSGAEVLTYREPLWYNAEIKPDMAAFVPGFCKEHGLTEMLKVYGVGDHGGGPTRRDLNRAIDMMSWPVFPRIRFGSYAEFYTHAESVYDQLPVVDHELNFIFTGCYTTQTRIKRANRFGENMLGDADTFSAMANAYAGRPLNKAGVQGAWRRILFNQFHDVLTGSGKQDTREHAMANFQEAAAVASTQATASMRAIAAKVDTSAIGSRPDDEANSVGAGVGFGVETFSFQRTEVGSGKRRIFHLFNACAHPRSEVVELTVWDWTYDTARMGFHTPDGKPLRHQILEAKPHWFWTHDYMSVLVEVSVPALGYATIVLDEKDTLDAPLEFPRDPRVHTAPSFVLENELLRAAIDPHTGAVSSLFDKQSGAELAAEPFGMFRFIEEDPSLGMTSWYVGRYMRETPLTENARVRKTISGPLYNAVEIIIPCRASKIVATVGLRAGSDALEIATQVEWYERGTRETCIPQLQFRFPLGFKADAALYDTPGCVVTRGQQMLDVPANTFAAARYRKDRALMLQTDSKYGFRFDEDALSVTLIRSSSDPDTAPEFGDHRFTIYLRAADASDNTALIRASQTRERPVTYVTGTSHAGSLPLDLSVASIASGACALTAVKLAEDGNSWILRGFELNGESGSAAIRLGKAPKSAALVNLLEQPSGGGVKIDGNTVSFALKPNGLFNIKVAF